ncbi:hypothetical protein ACK8HX_02030 [Oryzobacter sp. R7]|uniref:phage holin n=1 Tax=Oryzobacter faecalis TaxID=3388656 RepID=UPI00398D5F92
MTRASIGRVVDVAVAWLTPARRKAIYAVIAAVGLFLSVAGVVDPALAASVGGLIVSVVEVAAMLLGSVKARRWDWKAIYAALAAVVTALKVLGWLTPGQESYILDVLAHGIAVLPLVALVIRTDPSTATGEPAGEVVAATVLPIQRAGED